MIKQLDSISITDMDNISNHLWLNIKDAPIQTHCLKVINDQVVPYEFILKLLIKMGFECEHSIRLMMTLHSEDSVVLAKADMELLVRLQEYMDAQAKNHRVKLYTEILEV